MANHFTTIGLSVHSPDDFRSVLDHGLKHGEHIVAAHGSYRCWKIGNGAELWLQLDEDGQLIGAHPHFSGQTRLNARLIERVERPDDNVLDGAFKAWANGSDDSDGDFPFVFDCPDMQSYSAIDLPVNVQVQVAAFAHEISAYASVDQFDAAQAEQKEESGMPGFASQSFIPSGLFMAAREKTAPVSEGILSGHVRDTNRFYNPEGGMSFVWARVATYGGEFDVVADADIIDGFVRVGGVITGSFYLSGRLIDMPLRA
jgi:hypothetical protein